jgi:hypothetical protein
MNNNTRTIDDPCFGTGETSLNRRIFESGDQIGATSSSRDQPLSR